MIIGLSGYAGAGKDSVAKILVEQHGFIRIGFADALREHLEILDPVVWSTDLGKLVHLTEVLDIITWDAAKRTYSELRRLMQVYGTEVVRQKVGENYWVNQVIDAVEVNLEQDWVIPDVRFANEAMMLSALGAKHYVVLRDGYGPISDHASDSAPYHLIGIKAGAFFNYGTMQDLEDEVAAALKCARRELP